MKYYMYGLCFWALCAIVRCLLFKKLELISWHSLIPGYGTYILTEKVWNLKWFWVYIISMVLAIGINQFCFPDLLSQLLLFICIGFVVFGWTAQCYYTTKALKQNLLCGYGLAILFPIFGLVMGLKKESSKEE